MNVTWEQLKIVSKSKNISMQYIELPGSFVISLFDNFQEVTCRLLKYPTDTTDLTDFLTNYISNCNVQNDQPNIIYQETFYKTVDENTEERSPGFTPSNGKHLAASRFRANGCDPNAYVSLIWDRGGDSERVIASTRGDIDIILNTSVHELHFTGDGSKKFQICIINNSDNTSPIIGGSYEVVEVI